MAEAWDEKAIFLAALDLVPEAREAYLAGACPTVEARERVMALLRHHAGTLWAPDPPEATRTAGAGPKLPDRIDEFKILGRLGEGGMGVVYLAEDTVLGRRVALKVLAGHLLGSEQALTRFRDEARSAAILNHPAIVPVYKFGFDGKNHYIVSEYVNGVTLSSIINSEKVRRQSAPRAGELRAWCRRCAETLAVIADALDCSHRANVIHRDVKPSNILIDQTHGPRLTDFGIAKHLTPDAGGDQTGIVGSCHYMSPEQAAVADRRVDQRSDIFSLGVVLYEMISLQRPFEGRTMHEVLKAVVELDPRRLRTIDRRIPKDLETICHKSVEKDPKNRYQTAAHVAADLRCFLSGDPILAVPPSIARRVLRRARRHTYASLITASTILVTVFAFIEVHRWRTSKCAVSISASCIGSRVLARRYNSASLLGTPIDLGTVPFRNVYLPAGQYRLEFIASDNKFETDLFLPVPNREYDCNFDFPISHRVTNDMVLVPESIHRLGRESGDSIDAARTVSLPAFWIDVHEVSNRAYKSFADERHFPYPPHWRAHGFDDHFADCPIVGISWSDMQEFARWAGKRLPTAWEWEAAGRYPDARLLPWGRRPASAVSAAAIEHFRADRRVDPQSAYTIYRDLAKPVSSCPELCSQLGVFHMFGNVSEMTASIVPDQPEIMVVKGGNWFDTPETWDLSRCTTFPRDSISMNIGFRCARSASFTTSH